LEGLGEECTGKFGRARIPSSLGERGLGPGLKRGTEKCHKSYEMME